MHSRHAGGLSCRRNASALGTASMAATPLSSADRCSHDAHSIAKADVLSLCLLCCCMGKGRLPNPTEGTCPRFGPVSTRQCVLDSGRHGASVHGASDTNQRLPGEGGRGWGQQAKGLLLLAAMSIRRVELLAIDCESTLPLVHGALWLRSCRRRQHLVRTAGLAEAADMGEGGRLLGSELAAKQCRIQIWLISL